jgi:DeoR family transcriptional regulator, suf operon transcriptional repressor
MSQHTAPTEHRASDAALIDLLRVDDGLLGSGLGIGELAKRLGVTATAVRQRLDRLMRAGLVGRTIVSGGLSGGGQRVAGRLRGRPSHVYNLTEKGRRTGGDNFRDLALVLWREIRSVREPAVRQGLISRIGSAMAGMYRDEVSGTTPRQRLESTAKILQERRISCGVEPIASPSNSGLSVLTSYACPYPDLAEQDRGICAAERLMLQDLVGSAVRLSECRLDGASCCRFTVGGDDSPTRVENDALPATGATCIKPG